MNRHQYQIYKNMPTYQRLRIGCQLHDFALNRLKIQLHQQMKNANKKTIQNVILKRFLGESTGILFKNTKDTG